MSIQKEIITITDIAMRAGVSIGTVDRVLHNRGRVALETNVKVKKIVNELGYKPNFFASRLSKAKTFNFAVLIPKPYQDSKYWELSIKGIEKAARELAHYHINIKYFFYDRYMISQFREACQKIIETNCDGILIAPLIPNAVKSFITRLPVAIPYVFINSLVKDMIPLSFIGQDSFKSGAVCGKLMKMITRKQSTIAIIITMQNDLHIKYRAEGFRSLYSDDPTVTIKEYEIFNFEDKSCSAIRRIFEENNDLQGIFVTNVFVHHIAEYIKNNVKDKKVFLIGYDLIDKNIEYLNENIIDFLINQKPEQQGYDGIYALYKNVVLHEPCASSVSMPIDIITKENVNYYLNS